MAAGRRGAGTGRRRAAARAGAGLVLAALAALAADGPARAFHSGGVASCGGCHTMHDPARAFNPTNYLLKGANATDVCLNCHATSSGNSWGRIATMPGDQYGGGAFIFLTEDNLNDAPGGANPANWIRGDAAGHNLVSVDYGLAADPRFVRSPGGNYPAAALGCTSCHDPHGRNAHFRMLYGSDSNPSRANGHAFQFNTAAPDAVGIDLDGSGESPTNHVAYRDGMTDWCGNCHGRYHSEGSGSSFLHPIDQPLDVRMIDTYNRYRGTGFLDADPALSYEPLVPYEDASMTTATTGPTPMSARVTCVSCHRAHASSGPAAGRWDFRIELWSQEGASGSYIIPNPYQTTAGNRQKPLCAKCHGD